MSSIAELMSHDHRSCDHDFARLESLVEQGDWAAADKALERFAAVLNAHFDAEENTLFPAFEEATGMTEGPTRVMRSEHADMRNMLADLRTALAARDGEEFAGEAETLMIMMQQHNMKEESVLYPMCDARLAAQRETLCNTLDQALQREEKA